MKTALTVFSLLFITCWTATAGEFDPAEVPGSVKWVVHVDLEKARTTQIGKRVMQELSKGDADRKLSALSMILRFDPRKDLNSMTMFGQNEQPASAAVLLEGAFDAAALVTMIRGNDEYTSENHGDQMIHGWVDDGKRTFGAIQGSSIILSQGKAMVKQALDVANGSKKHLAADSGLIPPAEANSFFSAAANMKALGKMKEVDAAMLKQADLVGIALSETGRHMQGTLNVTAANEEVAGQLHAMVQGVIAFAQLNGEESPELQQLAKSVKVLQNGSQVGLSMLLPVADILEMMEENQDWKGQF